MTDDDGSKAELQKRIRSLESSSRQLRIFCVLVFIIGVISLYQNFVSRYYILDMNGSLNVRDEHEQPRAILYAQERNSGLTLYDDRDRDRAMFGATEEGSGLTLRDSRSNQRIILRVNSDGPEIIMTDNNGRIRYRMTVDESGGRMVTYDDSGMKTFDSMDPDNREVASSSPAEAAAPLP